MNRWTLGVLCSAALMVSGACSSAPQSSTATAPTPTTATAAIRAGTTIAPTTGPPAATTASTTTVPAVFAGLALGQAGCAPPSPIVKNEIRGTTSDGIELYALLFARTPIRAHDEVKLVWRITAGGPVVSATSATGTTAKVTFGPESHLSSSFSRPGDEWGIGYVFDQPGCWHLQFRSDSRANIWLMVEP